MDIGQLTTTEAVRAVLGISALSGELPDDAFLEHETEKELLLWLGRWLKSATNSAYTVTSILSGTDETAISILETIAKYWCAIRFVPSLTTMTAKQSSDGQNEFQRQDRNPEELKRELQGMLDEYLQMLIDQLAVDQESTFSIMGISSPTYDPITG